MRTFTRVIASSVVFNATSNAIGISTAATTSQFGYAAQGGPSKVEYYRGYTLQFNFGGNGTASSGLYGGLLNLLVSNVLEKPMFVTASSALISSTGSVMFNATHANYQYVDFQFIPLVTSTTGFFTAILSEKTGS